MPQEYVNRLAASRRLTLVTHLVATLQEKIDWENRKILLVGYLPEATQSHMRQKSPMGYNIRRGMVLVGHELGRGRKAGDSLEIRGKSLRIERVLPEQGSKEDITLAVNLQDAQEISIRKAWSIRSWLWDACARQPAQHPPTIGRSPAGHTSSSFVPLPWPGPKSGPWSRPNGRRFSGHDRLAPRSTRLRGLGRRAHALVVLASAVWVGLWPCQRASATHGNRPAQGRRKRPATIWTLFLGKAVLIGTLGACADACWESGRPRVGRARLGLAAEHFYVQTQSWCALDRAPAVSAVASYLPTLSALPGSGRRAPRAMTADGIGNAKAGQVRPPNAPHSTGCSRLAMAGDDGPAPTLRPSAKRAPESGPPARRETPSDFRQAVAVGDHAGVGRRLQEFFQVPGVVQSLDVLPAYQTKLCRTKQ